MNHDSLFRSREILITLTTVALGAAFHLRCSEDNGTNPSPTVSSRAYRGHASDADINNFVRVHPEAVGTRLDDCQTCHRGGTVTSTGGDVHANACDYCHYIIHPPEGWTGLPTGFAETLNPYGAAYDAAGRSATAIRSIEGDDSRRSRE